MNKERIWQGTMFEALRHTLKQQGIYAVDVDMDADNADFRECLRCGDDGYTVCCDGGTCCKEVGIDALLADACLYRKRLSYELREMTLLAAMAYTQEKGLAWLERDTGFRYSLAEDGKVLMWDTGTHASTRIPFLPGILCSDVATWRIPTGFQWTALTVAEVEGLVAGV